MTLDTGDEQFIGISLRVLNEVRRRLLGGNSNEGDTLVGRLEPNNFGTFNRTTRLVALVALSLATFSLLLLLRRC